MWDAVLAERLHDVVEIPHCPVGSGPIVQVVEHVLVAASAGAAALGANCLFAAAGTTHAPDHEEVMTQVWHVAGQHFPSVVSFPASRAHDRSPVGRTAKFSGWLCTSRPIASAALLPASHNSVWPVMNAMKSPERTRTVTCPPRYVVSSPKSWSI